jgi:uncharacterized protein YqjF (DUF2071 family)
MLLATPGIKERLAIREKPTAQPIMHQTWGKLLFMHWPVPIELLRPKIPSRLEIDTHDSLAWIAITPFTMWNVRAVGVPAIPGLNSFHECNVRTYVHLDGVPGVWFFSLDATKIIPVLAARIFFALNYLKAQIDLCQVASTINYALKRPAQEAGSAAELEVSWTIGNGLPLSQPESREFFFTERYCLYAGTNQQLSRARIWHPPWSLRTATLNSFRSTMIASQALPEPDGAPHLQYSEELDVLIYAPEEV